MNTYIHSLINALKHSQVRASYYEQTGDVRFLNESSDWLEVAQIYIKEILSNE